MKTIINTSTNPYYNLALMEYFLKNHNEEFILVFENKNTIIVGRNQNTYEVVNESFVKKHKSNVIRRISGGGAVYQDSGNINFVYIMGIKDNFNNFTKFTTPVIDLLKSYGIKAEFKGRNDIEVNGTKVSGNAQTTYKNRMMHGGTILFDANLDRVAEALNVDAAKYESKGIKSNRARVMNIKSLLSDSISIEAFKNNLLIKILDTEAIDSLIYTVTKDDEKAIQTLMKTKYKTWEWNYGKSPNYNTVKHKRFKTGLISAYILIKKGCIQEINFYSDGLHLENVAILKDCLKGTPYNEHAIREKLLEFESFGDFSIDDVLKCLFNE